MPATYDMIMIGDGCASMMLLEALSRREGFEKLNILLLGAGAKLDRSWCFWEKELPRPYQGMVKQTWNKMAVLSSPFQKTETLAKRPYHYIPGEAFFAYFTEQFLPAHHNVHHVVAPVSGIEGQPGQFTVHTQQGSYHAAQVYNSGYVPTPPKVEVWQHFRGWFIEWDHPVHDPETAVLMDFDVPQDKGFSFMYVLPLNSRSALVEYTFFGSTLWEAQVYEAELKTYIEKKYGTGYRIVHTETGKIPMQQGVFTPTGPCGEINIGTLGGMVKAGTGYAFRRMRRDSEALAEAWFTNNSPQRAASNRRFSWYDSLLLWIIRYHPEACKNIFTKLFAGQKMEQVIRFMDEETKLHEELFIISSLPKRIFLQALFARPKSVDQPIAGREPVLSPT